MTPQLAPLFVKTADSRHLIGAAVGAGLGALTAPRPSYPGEPSSTGERMAVGALGGALVGHHAAQIGNALKTHAGDALHAAGQRFGEGATEGAARAAAKHKDAVNAFARDTASSAVQGGAHAAKEEVRNVIPRSVRRLFS